MLWSRTIFWSQNNFLDHKIICTAISSTKRARLSKTVCWKSWWCKIFCGPEQDFGAETKILEHKIFCTFFFWIIIFFCWKSWGCKILWSRQNILEPKCFFWITKYFALSFLQQKGQDFQTLFAEKAEGTKCLRPSKIFWSQNGFFWTTKYFAPSLFQQMSQEFQKLFLAEKVEGVKYFAVQNNILEAKYFSGPRNILHLHFFQRGGQDFQKLVAEKTEGAK